jgi:hypothetical protein
MQLEGGFGGMQLKIEMNPKIAKARQWPFNNHPTVTVDSASSISSEGDEPNTDATTDGYGLSLDTIT